MRPDPPDGKGANRASENREIDDVPRLSKGRQG
jgi:hypothetical protein